MAPSPSLATIFWELIDPLLFLYLAASYLPLTISNLLSTSQYNILASPSRFKYAWFARFWADVGPEIKKNAIPRAGPLIAQARGVVLDIGPGSGEWLTLFPKENITKIYGVEPNRDHHALLKERIKEAGLEGIYEIVPVGVEDLGDKWVGMGEVDTVVTVQCLCSVTEPERMIGGLYGYLREGGRWVVYEHVVVFGWQGVGVRLWQAAIDLVWPHFLGGCSLTRDTEKWLRDAGKWEKFALVQPADEQWSHLVPHVMGVLTK